MRKNNVVSVVESDFYGCGENMMDYAYAHHTYKEVSNGVRNTQTELIREATNFHSNEMLYTLMESNIRQ